MKMINKKNAIISGVVLVLVFLAFITISANRNNNNTNAIASNESEMTDDTLRPRYEMTGNQGLVDWYRFKDNFTDSMQTKVWNRQKEEIDDPVIY